MTANRDIRLADECWVALALLHRSHPDRVSFSAREIRERLRQERAYPEEREGVKAHIYGHLVANSPRDTGRYRMFYRMKDGTFRLFRPGDDFHPSRTSKTEPERSELPSRYHELLDWYEAVYSKERVAGQEGDPVLAMRGVGKEIWQEEDGDSFVARERSGWKQTVEP